jgi:hypothetical protein
MALTAVELCAAALVKLGADPIISFTESRLEASVAQRLYPIVLDGLLAAHPWSFSVTQQGLTAGATAPVADFAYAFNLPTGCLRVLSAGHTGSGRGLDYRVQGSKLLANAPELVVTYQRRPSEAELPAFFVSALVARLAAEFCLPITENASRAETLQQLAQSELRLARLVDSQQSTPRRVEDFTLIQARES